MNDRAPRVSVVIPAYYSDAHLAHCLRAFTTQTFQDFELIIVNSSPEKQTQEIVQTEFPGAIFFHSPTRLLPHAARNLGLALARGELLATTDPDCAPAPDWLEKLVAAMDAGNSIVQGSVDLVGHNWRERGIHVCKRYALMPGVPPYAPWIVSTINVCYTRAVWQAAGPFEESLFCADALLGWRAAARGYRACFVPRAVVSNYHDESVWELARVRYERGLEFSPQRAAYEHWSRARMALYALALPPLFAIVVARSFRCALQAGWALSFIATMPVHLLGQLTWLVGECQGYLHQAFHAGEAEKNESRAEWPSQTF